MASAAISSSTITLTNPVVTPITDSAQSQPWQPSSASPNYTENITYREIPRFSLQTEEINTHTCLPKEPIVCNWSLNFVLSSSSVSSISSASSSLPCNQNKPVEQTAFFFTFMWPCIVTSDHASWQVTVHRDKWPCIMTSDRASWQVTMHRDKWPCIVTNFFLMKLTRCTIFTNLFWHETVHVSDSSSVHHQEFIHCTLSNGICHTGL